MSGTAFTYPLAKRIVSSTKWTEEQRGIIPDIESPSYFNGNQQLLLRTNSTLPSGYSGAMAVQGEIVDQNQDGTYSKKMPVWIRDQNGGTLSANTIYQGISAGTYTQDITTNGITASTTLGLYLVQSGSGAPGTSLAAGSFIAGNIGPNYNGSAAILYFYNEQNFAQYYTLLNVSPTSWQITTVRRYGVASVVDPVLKTANITFFSPIMFFAECQKAGNLYTQRIVNKNIPLIDPLNLSIGFGTYGYFNALIYDMGQPLFDPIIGMVTHPQWLWSGGSNPFAPLVPSGIGSGIGSGISGV